VLAVTQTGYMVALVEVSSVTPMLVALVADPTLAAAKTGSLTTRTDDNTGTLTMASGHGISTGNRLDVYWATGIPYGMTVGSVSVNSVPIDGGAGDNLPTANTSITAMVPQLEEITLPSTEDAKGIAITCPGKAIAVFRNAADTVLLVGEVTTTNDYLWDGSGTNPLGTGEDLADVYLSHGDSTAARQISVVVLKD